MKIISALSNSHFSDRQGQGKWNLSGREELGCEWRRKTGWVERGHGGEGGRQRWEGAEQVLMLPGRVRRRAEKRGDGGWGWCLRGWEPGGHSAAAGAGPAAGEACFCPGEPEANLGFSSSQGGTTPTGGGTCPQKASVGIAGSSPCTTCGRRGLLSRPQHVHAKAC